MLIERKQEIAGLPALEARRLLRELRQEAWSVGTFAGALGMTLAEADELVARLRAARLVEPIARGIAATYRVTDEELAVVRETGTEPELWGPSIAGTALAKARAGRAMPRDRAEALLAGVVTRAVEVNRSEAWLHWVTRVVLYGSFSDATRQAVGDVDVAVELASRVSRDDYVDQSRAMAEADRPASAMTFNDQLTHPVRKLLSHLRARSPRIDLVLIEPGGPGLPPGAQYQDVYTFEPP